MRKHEHIFDKNGQCNFKGCGVLVPSLVVEVKGFDPMKCPCERLRGTNLEGMMYHL
jgi:hypothetical protein